MIHKLIMFRWLEILPSNTHNIGSHSIKPWMSSNSWILLSLPPKCLKVCSTIPGNLPPLLKPTRRDIQLSVPLLVCLSPISSSFFLSPPVSCCCLPSHLPHLLLLLCFLLSDLRLWLLSPSTLYISICITQDNLQTQGFYLSYIFRNLLQSVETYL